MCAAINRFTSLPESADGRSRSSSPDGLMAALFGQGPVPANFFQPLLEVVTERLICGRSGCDSSLAYNLVASLVNRLPVPGLGSMASVMIWKPWVTRSGRRFSRLSLSAKTMRAIGFTLLHTPTAKANQAARSMEKWPSCRGLVVTPETWNDRMGFPRAWLDCAPMGMLSSRKSQRNS